RDVFRLRARAVGYIRTFLDARGYLEVETPVLQPVYGGASARPFVTHYEALDTDVYLRIADELYLKRCIVGGLEKVYEIGHDFRNEGMDRFHNPEFTMAEWYEAYADYEVMRQGTEEMLSGMVQELFGTTTLERHGATLDFKRPFAHKDYYALVRETAGIDLAVASEAELRAALKRKDVADADQLSGAKLVDEVCKNYVAPWRAWPTIVASATSSPFACSGRDRLPLRAGRRPALPAEPPRLAAALAHRRDRRGRGDGRRHAAHRGRGGDERAPGGPARQGPGA